MSLASGTRPSIAWESPQISASFTASWVAERTTSQSAAGRSSRSSSRPGTRFCPDAVLFHSANDTNQDHQQVHAEALRALKRHATLLCYEFPNNMLRFDGRFFVHFDQADLIAKHEALAEYRSLRSQWGERNERYGLDTVSYLDPDAVDAIAKARGHQSGGRLAECFEVLRWIS